jgi:metal iron transporter
MMVAVAYMDPGNYSTAVSGGAAKRYALLFVILLATVLALFLQSLAVKLGSVTGRDLAANIRRHLPFWLSVVLYVFAEGAIIATDIAEVIGTAIALNILLHIPLIAGVAMTIVDVVLILLAYQPGKGMLAVRIFEYGITALVFVVVLCFAVELSKVPTLPAGEIFRGFLPSSKLISDGGMYLSSGILGATVMPHSLYLGSSLVKSRIKRYDRRHGYDKEDNGDFYHDGYEPSLEAIRWSYKYSIIELFLALCTVAIFVNSSILIVAGRTLYGSQEAENADLYSIYDMLGQYVSQAVAVIFMVALVCSGQSAGIICTIAGQIVCEGHINWKIRPWVRRIVTRLIAIAPCIVVAAAVGREGLAAVLNASQVALTITLPFLVAPLIYLTSRRKVMTVHTRTYERSAGQTDVDNSEGGVVMANSWPVAIFGFVVWLFLAVLNVYLIVTLAMGQS